MVSKYIHLVEVYVRRLGDVARVEDALTRLCAAVVAVGLVINQRSRDEVSVYVVIATAELERVVKVLKSLLRNRVSIAVRRVDLEEALREYPLVSQIIECIDF